MSDDVLPLLWLTFLLIGGAWLLSTLTVLPMVRGLVEGARDPAARGRRALLMASVPWLAPATVGAAALTTAGSKALGWITDHCPHHGLGHPHLCFSHLPAMDLGWIHGAIVGAVGLVLASSLVRLVRTEYRTTKQLTLLKALAASRGNLRIVSVSAPFAVAGGLIRPVVLLSRGLLEELSSRQRCIVLAHEAAHLRHGDARRNVLFEMLLMLHPPAVRRHLRTQWLRALEEQADDAVARRFGAEQVVETLLQVARLKRRRPVPGFSVAGVDLSHRAQRLLDGDCGGSVGAPAFEVTYVVVLATMFTAVVMGHHALETLLGLIAGH